MSRAMGAESAQSRTLGWRTEFGGRSVRNGYLSSVVGRREAGTRGAGPGGAGVRGSLGPAALGGGAGICCDRHEMPRFYPRQHKDILRSRLWRNSVENLVAHHRAFRLSNVGTLHERAIGHQGVGVVNPSTNAVSAPVGPAYRPSSRETESLTCVMAR